MKLIDLLVKMEKGEDIPPKFKCDGYVWEYKETMKDWYSSKNQCYMFYEYFKENLKNCLWYEVEIIEDKPEKIEKLNVKGNCLIDERGVGCSLNKHTIVIANKLNEVIDKLNYLLERSDK